MSAFSALSILAGFFAILTIVLTVMAIIDRRRREMFGFAAGMFGLFVFLTVVVLFWANSVMPQ